MAGSFGWPVPGLVRPAYVFDGLIITRSALLSVGIETRAAPELYGPMYTITSGSLIARLAFSLSLPASQNPRSGDASSQSSYTTEAPSIVLPTSSSAILIALTIESVWALFAPVRGSEETILIGPT